MIQMRHTANELRVTLDHVLHGSEAGVEPQNTDEGVTFLSDSGVHVGGVHNIPEVSARMICKSFANTTVKGT